MIVSNGVATTMPPDSFADRTPMVDATYYPSGSALELVGRWSAYGELYARQIWVSTVIRKLAFSHARLPFVITTAAGVGRVDVPVPTRDDTSQGANAFAGLMARPSPRLDPFSLWLWTSSTYDIFGEAYWMKMRDGNDVVRELYPMHPTQIVIKRSSSGEVEYRHYSSGKTVAERDVVPFRNYNPENVARGLSNLEPLRMTLINEDASRRATASWWMKGARPSVLLHHPKRLGDEAANRLRKQAQADHGGVDNAGGAMVLEEGMTATVVQLSAEEMQYVESRKLNREEVCAAFDVPPPVVHILDRATFSNITEQMRSMYRDTMTPRLGLFEAVIDHHLRPDFGGVELAGAFNLDEVLRGDFEARAAAVAPLVQSGVYKPSEARPLFGLPDAGDVADRLYANSALQPLGAAPITQPQAAPQVTPLRAARLVCRPEVRSLLGGISRKSASEQRAALVTEHAHALRNYFDRQHAAILASGDFADEDWDGELSELLGPLTETTARAAGGHVARLLGGTFDVAALAAWLDTNVSLAARNINATTGDAVRRALDEPDVRAALFALFDAMTSRADQIAESRVNSVANFSELDAAKQSGGGTKTWVVNSGNPRPSHAEMDGETVAVEEPFSNGMEFPGDPAAGPEENANCSCSLAFGGTSNE